MVDVPVWHDGLEPSRKRDRRSLYEGYLQPDPNDEMRHAAQLCRLNPDGGDLWANVLLNIAQAWERDRRRRGTEYADMDLLYMDTITLARHIIDRGEVDA